MSRFVLCLFTEEDFTSSMAWCCQGSPSGIKHPQPWSAVTMATWHLQTLQATLQHLLLQAIPVEKGHCSFSIPERASWEDRTPCTGNHSLKGGWCDTDQGPLDNNRKWFFKSACLLTWGRGGGGKTARSEETSWTKGEVRKIRGHSQMKAGGWEGHRVRA